MKENPFHAVLIAGGFVSVSESRFKMNGAYCQDKTPDTTAITYELPSVPSKWRAQVTLPDQGRDHVYYKTPSGEVKVAYTAEWLQGLLTQTIA